MNSPKVKAITLPIDKVRPLGGGRCGKCLRGVDMPCHWEPQP